MVLFQYTVKFNIKVQTMIFFVQYQVQAYNHQRPHQGLCSERPVVTDRDD